MASIGVEPQRSRASVAAPSAISRSMADGVRANARIDPPFGARSGNTPSRSESATRWSSASISASSSPTRAPRRNSSSRIATRSRSMVSINGDQRS